MGPQTKRWIGVALLPQAGVALGMALLVGQHFPDVKQTIVPVIIGSTVVFEIAGPLLIKRALVATGEAER